MSDPLPQAMVLTAIVISLATIGFLLALSYRLWQISGTDDVPDDAEDAAHPAPRPRRRDVRDLRPVRGVDDDLRRARRGGRDADG